MNGTTDLWVLGAAWTRKSLAVRAEGGHLHWDPAALWEAGDCFQSLEKASLLQRKLPSLASESTFDEPN